MTKASIINRREFISKLSATIGGSATFAMTSSIVSAAPVIEKPEKTEVKPQSKGYQRTQHVDTYYHLADL